MNCPLEKRTLQSRVALPIKVFSIKTLMALSDAKGKVDVTFIIILNKLNNFNNLDRHSKTISHVKRLH